MKNGELSKRELETIRRAWSILSKWSEWADEDARAHGYEPSADPSYCDAMTAVAGLCEFIGDMSV